MTWINGRWPNHTRSRPRAAAREAVNAEESRAIQVISGVGPETRTVIRFASHGTRSGASRSRTSGRSLRLRPVGPQSRQSPGHHDRLDRLLPRRDQPQVVERWSDALPGPARSITAVRAGRGARWGGGWGSHGDGDGPCGFAGAVRVYRRQCPSLPAGSPASMRAGQRSPRKIRMRWTYSRSWRDTDARGGRTG